MAKRKPEKQREPWDQRTSARRGGRNVDTRSTYRRFLILCEGVQTEPNYFKGFRPFVRDTEIVVIGFGKDPATLVQKARGCREELENRATAPFDAVWCVFDKDHFGDAFVRALREAGEAGLEVAYSNPCVELWFVLHFPPVQHPVSAPELTAWLSEYLKRPYSKDDQNLFGTFLSSLDGAISRSEALFESHRSKPGGLNPASQNPITRVHELAKRLSANMR